MKELKEIIPYQQTA